MNMPNVPTDNLYKFLSISGLIILFFAIVLPQYAIFQLEMRLIDAKTNQEKFEIEREMVKTSIDRVMLEQQVNDTVLMLSEVSGESSSKLEATKIKELLAEHERLAVEINKLNQLAMSQIDQSAINEKNKLMLSRIKSLSSLSVFMMLIGVLVTILGFSMWYYKTQRFLDSAISSSN